MIHSRQLAPWFLALMLGATPLLAQPETASSSASSSAPAAEGAADKPPATQPAPASSAPAPKNSGGSKKSPFEYRSSEQISEDVPVSFPVDI